MIAAVLIAAVAALAILAQADLSEPPRYDGAGYAVLARSLLEGHGYRAIDHPDEPRHAHFPPGYPAILAAAWYFGGPSAPLAHVLSCFCAVGATLAAWLWFRGFFPPQAALVLVLALAINWSWSRTGSTIQSEPFYALLSQLTILAASRVRAKRGTSSSLILGGLLAACLLTRHIAIGLVLAILADLALTRRWTTALRILGVTVLLVAPWIAWLIVVGSTHRTQANLFLEAPGLLARTASQSVFYVRRIPDQITGPLVEVATSLRPSRTTAAMATVLALAASMTILGGWIRALVQPRIRLAGLVPLMTLPPLLLWPYTEAGRFLLPLLPCLLVGATLGLSWILSRIVRGLATAEHERRTTLIAATLVLLASLPYPGFCFATIQARTRARRDAHRGFDAACTWLANNAKHAGPVLSRHPGEVFLASGRKGLEVSSSERPGEPDATPDEIEQTIRVYKVAYLLIADDRYASTVADPLKRFVTERKDRVRKVWSSQEEHSGAAIYEIVPAAAKPGPRMETTGTDHRWRAQEQATDEEKGKWPQMEKKRN
jgi:hypothetical protein